MKQLPLLQHWPAPAARLDLPAESGCRRAAWDQLTCCTAAPSAATCAVAATRAGAWPGELPGPWGQHLTTQLLASCGAQSWEPRASCSPHAWPGCQQAGLRADFADAPCPPPVVSLCRAREPSFKRPRMRWKPEEGHHQTGERFGFAAVQSSSKVLGSSCALGRKQGSHALQVLRQPATPLQLLCAGALPSRYAQSFAGARLLLLEGQPHVSLSLSFTAPCRHPLCAGVPPHTSGVGPGTHRLPGENQAGGREVRAGAHCAASG